MEGQNGEERDESSIRPVSSLRSHFESIAAAKAAPPPTPTSAGPPRRASGVNNVDAYQDRSGPNGRASLDVPRNATKLRPMSMGPLSPPRSPRASPPRSPPLVTVDSPNSPPRHHNTHQSVSTFGRRSQEEFRKPASSRSGSPTGGLKTFKIPSRSTTPALDTRNVPSLSTHSTPTSAGDPQKDPHPRPLSSSSTAPVPPPINRAGKPRIFSNKTVSAIADRKVSESLAPEPAGEKDEERVSPFSTPPSEPESPPAQDSSPPPPKTERSKPRNLQISPGKDFFAPPPFHYPKQRQQHHIHSPLHAQRLEHEGKRHRVLAPPIDYADAPEERPALPTRRESEQPRIRSRSPRPPPPAEPPVRKSMDNVRPSYPPRPSLETPPRQSLDSLSAGAAKVADVNSKFMPPPKRIPATTRKVHAPPPTQYKHEEEPPPMPARPSVDTARPSNDINREAPVRNGSVARLAESEDEELDMITEKQGSSLTDYPDSSQANRRPPLFSDSPSEIQTGYDTKLFAVCGEIVCTTGYLTRAWNIITGEKLMSITHGETTKATAVAFKPAKAVEDEGKRLWLGMSTGELIEIDIPTESVINTRSASTARFPIVKIVRHGSDMWTLDEEGKWLIWPSNEDGSPDLSNSPTTSRIPIGFGFSMIVGHELWVGYGKDLRVFTHDPSTRTATQVLSKPLSQTGVGEVTSGATISSQADRVYVGHIDGKVTIYSRKNYECLGIVNVSLYKIASLAGVGDFLWAAFNTGMIYVYDTTSTPWKVKKDWKAHHNTIAGVIVDRTSIWKLDRLQVATLGTDQIICLWDGMCRDDWLEQDMQERDTEYCDFREVTSLVMTWNAGAATPIALRYDKRDGDFIREMLLTPKQRPDILVFGFQELVDLEDKKVTARNIFKSTKKKDDSQREHMAHQYRDWRDHLCREVDHVMGAENGYTLVHTANLVGLFTCVFVRTAERSNIRDVSAAEVKLGMGGIYGNKGALIVRFILDDSSLCFINCHLAAGQRQTVHRNNDVAAIMESANLPPQKDDEVRAQHYVGGGDGSMILDHEICVLNGDLNYRIDAIPRDTCIAAVQKGDLSKLLEKDQLLLSRRKNPGFRLRAFQENPITFAPTYKYDVGTDTYDSSEKKRSPAWCDRLLYRGVGRIKMVEYRRHEVRVSDHRPVSGQFRLRIKTIDRERRGAVWDEAVRRFEEVRDRVAWDIKLDYLVNVFGLNQREAERLLKR